MSKILTVSLPPHIHAPGSVASCMWRVNLALLPALACSLYFFGLGAAIVIAVSVVSCMAVEYAVTRWMLGRKPRISDGSAVLTGLLLAMNLPSNLPVWTIIIGAVAAVGIGKMAFGGLGCNIFNPALVGRVFLLLSFPVLMTSWPIPGADRLAYTDAATGATILQLLKSGAVESENVNLLNLTLGNMGGSLGEVSAVALLLGMVYLVARRVITLHIPLSIFCGAIIMSFIAGVNPMVELLSGGLLLGAIFMATDYVTSPMTRTGMIIYGFMIGVLTIIIRCWGAYPEGMSFAILIMNGFTPLINRFVKPKRFGAERRIAGI